MPVACPTYLSVYVSNKVKDMYFYKNIIPLVVLLISFISLYSSGLRIWVLFNSEPTIDLPHAMTRRGSLDMLDLDVQHASAYMKLQ